MKLRFFRSFLSFSTLAGLAVLAADAAETGTVNQGTVNVRGRAGFIGEVITKVNQGDAVTILESVTLSKPQPGEPAEWLKIALPANTPVWIHSSYVDPNTQAITASRLKVRGGPTINHSVLGYLSQGTVVQSIRTQGEWMEIQPNEEFHAFIAASMVTRTTASVDPALVETTPAVVEPDPIASVPAPVETTPLVETVRVDETVPVVAETTLAPVVDSVPESTTIIAEPAPAILAAPVQSARELAADERAQQVLEQRTRDSQRWEITSEPTDALLKELPTNRRVVIREGEIRRAISIQAPSPYILQHIDTGLRLNYLYVGSGEIPVGELLGVRVRIRGEEGVDPRWPGTPVLLIKSLEVLP